MNGHFCLNPEYSTTRIISTQKPLLDVRPDDKFKSMLSLPEGRCRKGEGGLRTRGYFKRNIRGKPLLTVITVVFNGEQFLEKTILSVIEQTYDNVEYIIIDGGSTDATVDIIKKYSKQIDYWVSEHDSGISDAFNKGIVLATGQYLNFLNAGDEYISPCVLNENRSYFKFGSKIVSFFSKFGSKTIPKFRLFNSMPLYLKSTLSHQASFIHVSVFKRHGGYSREYSLRMDYDYWMRILRQCKFIFISKIIVNYATNGVSGGNTDLFCREEIEINKKYLCNLLFWIRRLVIFIRRLAPRC